MFRNMKILLKLSRSVSRLYISVRPYSENPFSRTWNVISKEISELLGGNKKPLIYPEHADIVIIGGGFIGSAVAYWLKTRAGEGLSVVILEKDLSYKHIHKNISLGTITQHYSLPENMHLAMYGAEFLRTVKEKLDPTLDINYCPHSHLVLASETYAHKLEETVAIQKEYGVRNELLTVEDLKQNYPWLNTKDISLGCIGTESEGTFNAGAFLLCLIKKNRELGAWYINAEVVGFELEQQRDVLMEGIEPGSFKKINRVLYRTPDSEEHAIKFAGCILAAGHESSNIAKLAKVGTGHGLLNVPLPIKERKQTVYSVDIGTPTGLNTPLITDTSGLWLRKNGMDNSLLCGHVPLLTSEIKDMQSKEFLENIIMPSLVNRVPSCEGAKVEQFTTELFDFNSFDDTGIIGPHPYYNNLYIAAGFGQQGCVYAPGIGRAIAELIIDSHYVNIDLTRFTFDRLLTGTPMIEMNMY